MTLNCGLCLICDFFLHQVRGGETGKRVGLIKPGCDDVRCAPDLRSAVSVRFATDRAPRLM